MAYPSTVYYNDSQRCGVDPVQFPQGFASRNVQRFTGLINNNIKCKPCTAVRCTVKFQLNRSPFFSVLYTTLAGTLGAGVVGGRRSSHIFFFSPQVTEILLYNIRRSNGLRSVPIRADKINRYIFTFKSNATYM